MLADARAPAPRVLTQTIESVVPVDPDRAVLDDAHMRAARCYDGFIFDAVTRTATIDVTVIPTGTVTHAEVRPGNTSAPEVLDCLRGLGQSLVYSDRTRDNGGGALRTYAIDEAVVPNHCGARLRSVS